MTRTFDRNRLIAIQMFQQGHTVDEVTQAGVPRATAYRAQQDYLKIGNMPTTSIISPSVSKPAPTGKGSKVQTPEGVIHQPSVRPGMAIALRLRPQILQIPYPEFLESAIIAASEIWDWPVDLAYSDFIDACLIVLFKRFGVELGGPGTYFIPEKRRDIAKMKEIDLETGEIKSFTGGDGNASQERPGGQGTGEGERI